MTIKTLPFGEVSFHKDMIMITEKELYALRYYTGDTSGTDPFWGDPKAYVVLNSLFFPGTATEESRAAEGKYLNPAIIEDTARLAGLLADLLSVFRKCRNEKGMTTYRVERYTDYQLMKSRGKTISFTSTSTAGFLDTYRDRRGIALMKFTIPENTPCIDMKSVLPYYAKADEAEVLLPPGMNLRIDEKAPYGIMKDITDANGAPPILYSEVITKEYAPCSRDAVIPDSKGAAAGKRVYSALNNGKVPDKSDTEQYILWKKSLTEYVINEEKKAEH